MKLSVIILTWNSLAQLQRCLSSIEQNTTLKNYEVIIIDNNSRDGTRRFLQSQNSGRYHTIFNSTNRGVGPARNQGLRIATGQYILILDVDTVVTAGAVDRLVEYLDKDQECGIVGSKLTDINGNLQFTCRCFPTIVSKALRRLPYKWAKLALHKEELRDWDHKSIRQVDYVIGACQMIRKKLVEAVGLIDDKIFYGPEDVDYCLRAWQSGYKVIYNPNSVIIHDEQRITKKKLFSRITLEHVKALAYYFIKHRYLFSREKIYMHFPQGKCKM